jgi:hypothetical protein
MDHLTSQVSFRFQHLTKLQAFTLEREIQAVTISETTEQGRFTASLSLDKADFDAITMFYVRQNIEISSCTIVIYLKPSDAVGFSVPVAVNQMLKHIDCRLHIQLHSEDSA